MESVNHENIGDLKRIHIQNDQSSTNSIWMVAKEQYHITPQTAEHFRVPSADGGDEGEETEQGKKAHRKSRNIVGIGPSMVPIGWTELLACFTQTNTNTLTHFTFRVRATHSLAKMVYTFMHTSALPEYVISIRWWYCFVSLDLTFGVLCAHKIENCQRN